MRTDLPVAPAASLQQGGCWLYRPKTTAHSSRTELESGAWKRGLWLLPLMAGLLFVSCQPEVTQAELDAVLATEFTGLDENAPSTEA